LSETVSELLLLSRAGERSLAGTSVDLGDVVAVAAQRWTAEAAERKIALKVEVEGVPGSVWIAREDIDRALDALIENALHYSPAGTAVTLVTGPARIEVRDRGRGITSDEREFVFDRFRRGSAGRAGPSGHGLGLPIARELARAWGGDVLLEPRPGGGTCAVLDLSGVDRDPASAESDRRRFASA
ncbi:MAG TPA: HAMP domain-containing sensor histidine kinase, partial [Gaiellales bacterium]|nr:HAMP domain-containing sensor histidine kinase [Gaiellales bacterium]